MQAEHSENRRGVQKDRHMGRGGVLETERDEQEFKREQHTGADPRPKRAVAQRECAAAYQHQGANQQRRNRRANAELHYRPHPLCCSLDGHLLQAEEYALHRHQADGQRIERFADCTHCYCLRAVVVLVEWLFYAGNGRAAAARRGCCVRVGTTSRPRFTRKSARAQCPSP
jgi:hypothetical protein